jgi:aspartyl-tRNA(Asn)/glutamyl-tRNA(Gln) amidotransferase subunit A
MDLTSLTIKQAHEGLKNGDFTSVDLTKAYLKNIKKLDKEINAYLSVDESGALEQAKKVDEKIAKGQELSLLSGVPCAVKDNIMVDGQKCTAASKMLEKYTATYDATVVKKLKELGAVILGKTNLDEFAFGSSTENSALKTTKNPHDLTRVPGGSSGGSAAAVAANMACFALGSDTGCSIRNPASFCGISGLKTTYGAVSRYGLIASASSLDQIGPLTKNVEDAKIVFQAIHGRDKMDMTTADYNFNETAVDLNSLKIGVPKEYFSKGLDPEVEKIIRDAIEKLERIGAKIVKVSLPSCEFALACYYIIQTSEASANLARFDGIRYGLSTQDEDILNVYLKSRGKGLGAEAKRRIMLGTYCLSSGYYDAYYKKAQEIRQLIKKDFKKAFEAVDLIMGPVVPFPAFKIGEKLDDPLSMYLADIYTVPVNLAGLPGFSLPVGRIDNLPVGLQIIGNHFEENKILSVASQLEKMIE